MKKTNLLFLLFVAVMASCSKSPEDVVTSAYQSMKDAKYTDIAELLYLDKEQPLNDDENEMFAQFMQKSYAEDNALSTFTVQNCDVDEEKGIARYAVSTVYKSGKTYTEKGSLKKNEDGKWQIVVLKNANDSTATDSTSTAESDEDDSTEQGRPLEFAPNAAFCLTKVLAARGSMEAQLAMGYYVMEGVFTPDDNENDCVSWFEKSAKQGCAEAERMMGKIYYQGYYVERDDEKAFKWFEKASKKGDVEAVYFLGNCYRNGYGCEVDTEKARQCYRTAAEKGNASAQINYGYLIETVDYNLDEAVKWYLKAAEQGDMTAQYNLGQMNRTGRLGAVDFGAALEWYKKAAAQGQADAQNCLGSMYENGQGVEKNLSTAYEWYKKAARQGNMYGERNANRLAGHR